MYLTKTPILGTCAKHPANCWGIETLPMRGNPNPGASRTALSLRQTDVVHEMTRWRLSVFVVHF